MSQRICEFLIIFTALFICLLTFPVSFLMSVKLVKDYERIVILRLGRVLDKNACGTVYITPFVDQFFIIDLRLSVYEVDTQQVSLRFMDL